MVEVIVVGIDVVVVLVVDIDVVLVVDIVVVWTMLIVEAIKLVLEDVIVVAIVLVLVVTFLPVLDDVVVEFSVITIGIMAAARVRILITSAIISLIFDSFGSLSKMEIFLLMEILHACILLIGK